MTAIFNSMHDVRSPHFVRGKTELPPNADEVYGRSIPHTNQRGVTVYWGRGGKDIIYRFSPSNDGTVHFSGTMDFKDPNVPNDVRKALQNHPCE